MSARAWAKSGKSRPASESATAWRWPCTCPKAGTSSSVWSVIARCRPTRANFRTGSLTVCTMVPMRSVPHRVIALLGLDDGHFPRVAAVDGDDVLLRVPRVGERDRRSEDRQLLLDAVLAAGEHLLVLYPGADPLSGARRPPAAFHRRTMSTASCA